MWVAVNVFLMSAELQVISHFCLGSLRTFYSQIVENSTDAVKSSASRSTSSFSFFFVNITKCIDTFNVLNFFFASISVCFVFWGAQYAQIENGRRLMACQYTVNQLNVSIFLVVIVRSITSTEKKMFSLCQDIYNKIKTYWKTCANGIILGPLKLNTKRCAIYMYTFFWQSVWQSAFNFFLRCRQPKKKKKT